MKIPCIPTVDFSERKLLMYKTLIEKLILKFLEKGVTISESDSRGGYLSVSRVSSETHNWEFSGAVACGTFPEEKWKRYFCNAMEKPNRVVHYYSKEGAVTSYQSRNETTEEWGGSILHVREKGLFNGNEDGYDRLFGFSGLDEQYDDFCSVSAECFYSFIDDSTEDSIEDELFLTRAEIDRACKTFHEQKRLIAAEHLNHLAIMWDVFQEVAESYLRFAT